MKKIGFVIALILGISLSCKKDDAALINAKIIEGGGNSAEDCGWFLEADNVIYCPTNLDNSYKIDNLPVLVTFNFTDHSITGGFSTGHDYPRIDITEIRIN